MKEYSIFPKALALLETHHQIFLMSYPGHSFVRGWGFTLLLYSTDPTDWAEIRSELSKKKKASYQRHNSPTLTIPKTFLYPINDNINSLNFPVVLDVTRRINNTLNFIKKIYFIFCTE